MRKKFKKIKVGSIFRKQINKALFLIFVFTILNIPVLNGIALFLRLLKTGLISLFFNIATEPNPTAYY